MKRIDLVPRLNRRHATQVLVQSQFVVPSGEVEQQRVERLPVPQAQLAQHALQGSEQPLDTSVLPRVVNVTALVVNAQPTQSSREHLPGEARLVVGSNESRPAEVRDGEAQVSQQCPAAFVGKPRKPKRHPAAVVQDAQDGVDASLSICPSRHVQPPTVVESHRPRGSTANRAPRLSHRQRVLSEHPVNVRHAHRHLPVRKHPVKRQGNQAATRAGQVRLEQDQLPRRPIGLAPGATAAEVWLKSIIKASGSGG